ncbi:MAG: Holliday junction branch migration protein RuvA [Lachnospiraceae bacterium]
MYSYIKGELVSKSQDTIEVECHDIGYGIRVPGKIMDYLPPIGETVKLYTYLYVREDAFLLYGFLTQEDRKIFQLLIGVSGIGPKGALAILSVLSPDDLRFAVLSDDAKAITKAPGVGAKTAQRLILELRDKLSLEEAFELKKSHGQAEDSTIIPIKNEAVSALVALGYSSFEAAKVVQSIDITETMDVETVLKSALKQLALI